MAHHALGQRTHHCSMGQELPHGAHGRVVPAQQDLAQAAPAHRQWLTRVRTDIPGLLVRHVTVVVCCRDLRRRWATFATFHRIRLGHSLVHRMAFQGAHHWQWVHPRHRWMPITQVLYYPVVLHILAIHRCMGVHRPGLCQSTGGTLARQGCSYEGKIPLLLFRLVRLVGH